MSRAGYADFFPAAPSVLAKKAQAERAAKEKKARQVQVHHDDYDRDATGVLSTGSTTSTNSVPPSHPNPTLTPSTSHSSPPTQMSPAATAKSESQSFSTTNGDTKDPPPPPASLLTPKATPPATSFSSLKSEPQPKRDPQTMRARNEAGADKLKTSQQSKLSAHTADAEAIKTPPIPDPRKDILNYTDGPKKGKKRLRHALARVHWQWDSNYIGPGPPSQILVTGLSPLTTEAEVSMNFRTFGDIESCKMQVDPATGGSLGLCSIVYRDNKSERVLGHQAARAAVNKGSALKIAMQKIHVTLDRDGLKCAKVVSGILQRNQKKQDEVRKKEDEEAARRRPPPSGPRSGDAPERSTTLPIRPDGHRISDLDARFVKPRSPGHKAIDDLGTRPAIFVSGRDIPPELKYCKHLYGRLRNFGVDDVLYDRSGFFVVFQDVYGMERCFNICDREPLFNFTMNMKIFPHGNPEHKKVKEAAEKAKRDRKRKVKKLEPIDPVKETTASLIRDLKLALMSDVRKRIADVLIYDMLSPEKLKERAKKEEESAAAEPSAVKIETGMDSPAQLDSPMSGITPLPIVKPSISSLPRFKKRPVKRAVTPISDISHPRSKRLRDDARPLAHRLNNYDIDGSDDDASDRPVSRAMSTDVGEDDSSATPEAPHRKRKRSFGGHTPSRLRDGNMSSDEEDEDRAKSGDDGQTDLDKEMAEFIVDESDGEDAGQKKQPDYQRRADDAIFTPSASEDEHEARRKRMKSLDEDRDDIDVMGGLGMETVMTDGYTKPEGEEAPTPTPTELDDEPPPLDGMPVDLSWTMPTTDFPRPVVEDDDDIILDLDGIQNLCKDEEDFRFLRKALENEQKENIGNPHAFAFKLKEIKAANRDGKRGIIHEPEKIEGFYRPNPSGCARTEGYRRIPEAEKSMYLPHRLAVAAKRANIQTQAPSSSSTATNNGTTAAATTNKPVSSSRMNRVNNRRLVAELNNQKQILSGDADVMRFNQLKKRKKPVKFARSAIHNWGLYAMENISANDMIIEYVGEIVRQQVADLRERYYLKSGIGSSYLFRIDENTVIDATKRGGIARFINHSCTPNCTAKIIKVEGSKRIVIYALRDIKENEELTYDYKFERELDSEERIPCLCGSSGCKGFLN